MSISRPILGLIEEVKLYLPNNKFIRLKAKIDTGAHFSAVDKKFAVKLGYDKSLKIFKKFCPKFKITADNFEKIRRIIKNKYKRPLIKRCPGIVDVKLIPATNGFSIRPYFRIKFSIKNKKIVTRASLVERSHMKYLFLVGKADLKGFVINPEKHDYNTLG